ncbi:hypothetical protein [Labrenzia sp. 011]|uniref:hypothetical protein n=1 Tax=Labrenzia sp. 011 TaxID=2171494 RepID=UPI000D51B8CE|nr:hypothetical protein [Labrenzia sp. 011]PVB62385.1 hypothetical protein DCO57_06395 [Labrenzia sp. 011]
MKPEERDPNTYQAIEDSKRRTRLIKLLVIFLTGAGSILQNVGTETIADLLHSGMSFGTGGEVLEEMPALKKSDRLPGFIPASVRDAQTVSGCSHSLMGPAMPPRAAGKDLPASPVGG